MLGARVSTGWKVGNPITWSGSYGGEDFEDHGTILDFQPNTLLRTTHFSASGGQPDLPENFHTVTWRLTGSAK